MVITTQVKYVTYYFVKIVIEINNNFFELNISPEY